MTQISISYVQILLAIWLVGLSSAMVQSAIGQQANTEPNTEPIRVGTFSVVGCSSGRNY